MYANTPSADNETMTDEILNDLYDRAVDLVDASFECLTKEHVECVHARLIWNYQRGMGEVGAVTVH